MQENEYDIERLDFHLKTGDYFPMLATILGFIQESVGECACTTVTEMVPIETKLIQNVRKDLAYLHKNYRIVPHAEGEAN